MLLKVGLYTMALALAFAGVVAVFALREEPARAVGSTTQESTEATVEPLVREYLPLKPEATEQVKAEVSEAAEPETALPKPEPRPAPDQEPPQAERNNWPLPTSEQVEQASEPRHYELSDGAIMGLTVNALGLHNVPVFDSDAAWALDNGVSHEPGTSMPWSRSEQRNIYLQGHRLGWPGTGSHLVFYHLDRLKWGDLVTLRDRDGERYAYRVTETFVVEPNDSWVMGRVRGRDIVTLQTCTPIPTFEKRLVVRADRV
jgi:sortase A